MRRAVVVIGDEKGRVGVGTATAKEVVDAVQKAVADGKKHLITVSLPPHIVVQRAVADR